MESFFSTRLRYRQLHLPEHYMVDAKCRVNWTSREW